MKHYYKNIKDLSSDKLPKEVTEILNAAVKQLQIKSLEKEVKWMQDKKKYGKITVFDDRFRPVASFSMNKGIFKQGFLARWEEEDTKSGRRYICTETTIVNDNVIFSNKNIPNQKPDTIDQEHKPTDEGEL